MDVYTNGTLAPDEAVSLAAKVLSEHLNLFIDLSDNAKDTSILKIIVYIFWRTGANEFIWEVLMI